MFHKCKKIVNDWEQPIQKKKRSTLLILSHTTLCVKASFSVESGLGWNSTWSDGTVCSNFGKGVLCTRPEFQEITPRFNWSICYFLSDHQFRMRPAAHNISQTCSKYDFAKECKWKNSTPQEVFTQYHAIPVLNCFYSPILHTRQYLSLLVVVFAPRNQSGFWYNESHHATQLLHTLTQIVNRSSLCQFGEIRTVSWIVAQTTISKFSNTNFSEMQSLSQMCWF